MGLLDMFNTGDPERDQATRHGILQAGLALLQGKGNLGSILGQAGQQGLAGMQAFQGNQFQQKLRTAQLADIARKKVLEGRDDKKYERDQNLELLPSQFITPGTSVGSSAADAPAGIGEGQATPHSSYAPPTMDLAGLAQKYMSTPGGLQSGLALKSAIAPPKPTVLGKDQRLLEPGTNREIVGAVPEAGKQSDDIREFEYAKGRGDPAAQGSFTEWLRLNKKAGATNITQNADKGFASAFGGNVAEDIKTSRERANSAEFTNATIKDIRDAFKKGGVILGPGAGLRQTGLRIGQIISSGGQGADSLANTKNVEQGLAVIELEAAQLIKGQGQVTEAERAIIRKAAAGQIQDLSPGELEVALRAIERNNDRRIKAHESQVKKLQGNPALGSLGGLMGSTPVQNDEVLDWNNLPKGKR